MESKKGSKDIEMTDMSKTESKSGGPSKRTFANSKSATSAGGDSENDRLISSPRHSGGNDGNEPQSPKTELPVPPKSRLTRAEKQRRRRRGVVAQYATENFLNFVEFFQMFGLLWAIMFRVPWPTHWSLYTSWTVFANLDGEMYWFYHNYTTALIDRSNGTADPHFNLWGEIRGYALLYSGSWAVFFLVLLVLLFCIHGTKQSYNSRQCWQAPCLTNALQWLFYILYLPGAIALLRPFACSYSSFLDATVMDHDTTQECWRFEFSIEGMHGIVTIACGTIAGLFMLYVPIWTIAHLQRHVIFEGKERHEHFLLQKQAEYVLGINEHYVQHNFSFFSSFKQPAISFRVLVYVRRLVLVLSYIFLRADVVVMLDVMWALQVLWCIVATALAPYRVRSSNVVMLLLDYTFAVLGLLSLLRGADTSSDAFVDSTFQFILLGVTGTGVLLALLVWIVDGGCLACNPLPFQVAEPDDMTLHWVTEIARVKDTLDHLNARPLELIDLSELKDELKSMSNCFKEARESKHILRYTLQDCMEDVQATVDECEERAMFPNTKLTAVIPGLRAELEHEAEVHALVAPPSRRWIRKLEALRLFRIGYRGPQSDSDDDFADWEQGGAVDVSPAELLAQTQAVLVPPVHTEEAEALKKQWRAQIQRWKHDFFARTGAKPSTDDMWEIDEWRKNYLQLKEATKV